MLQMLRPPILWYVAIPTNMDSALWHPPPMALPFLSSTNVVELAWAGGGEGGMA